MEFQAATPSGGTENVSSEEVTGQSAVIVPDEETGHIEADVSTEEHSDNEPAADETIQEVAAEANEVPVQRVCSSCGAPLNEGAVFCGSCGTRQYIRVKGGGTVWTVPIIGNVLQKMRFGDTGRV